MSKWNCKASSILKTDNFLLNPKIIRKADDFRKYFDYLLLLSNYDEFIN